MKAPLRRSFLPYPWRSQLWRSLEWRVYAQLSAKANLELLLITLFTEFDPHQINLISEEDKRRATIHLLLSYVEEHYAEKLSLEDLADYTQYNRTYVSTLFKQMVGINFHEYLTRVRFQHALNDLTYTNENLTDIALKNGFPDLKTLDFLLPVPPFHLTHPVPGGVKTR